MNWSYKMNELETRLQVAETQLKELRDRAEHAERELKNQTKEYLENKDTLLRDCELNKRRFANKLREARCTCRVILEH